MACGDAVERIARAVQAENFLRSLRISTLAEDESNENFFAFGRSRLRPRGDASPHSRSRSRTMRASASKSIDAKNRREKRIGIFRDARTRASMMALRWRRWRALAAADAAASRHAGEKFFAQVLTVQKSVIRFRHSRTFLRKQVDAVIETLRTTTSPEDRRRTIGTKGALPSEKNSNASQADTRAARVAGVRVFVEGQGFQQRSQASTPSVAARLARRRLPAGPIPAAFLATGH